MPGFFHFMRGLARAAIRKGFRALAGLVPFGEVVIEVVQDAHQEFSKRLCQNLRTA